MMRVSLGPIQRCGEIADKEYVSEHEILFSAQAMGLLAALAFTSGERKFLGALFSFSLSLARDGHQ